MLIRTRALELLAQLYRFGEGKASPEQYDLSAPVQSVHDLSREIELASGYGRPVAPGMAVLQREHNHAMAGTLRDGFEPHSTVMALTNIGLSNLQPLSVSVWLLAVSAFSTVDGNVSDFAACYFPPSTIPSMFSNQRAGRPLIVGTTMSVCSDAAGTADAECSVPSEAIRFSPFELPIGSGITSRSTVGAAGLVDFNFLVWIGPRGARPPGIA